MRRSGAGSPHPSSTTTTTRACLRAAQEDVITQLAPLKADRAVAVLVVDVMDIPGSFPKGLTDHIGDKVPILLVANKVDVLWSNMKLRRNEQHLAVWLKQQAAAAGFGNIEGVVPVSARTGWGLERLVNRVVKLCTKRESRWNPKVRDAYIIGATNAGKSSLINQLRNDQVAGVTPPLTTSVIPGTTLFNLAFTVTIGKDNRASVRARAGGKGRGGKGPAAGAAGAAGAGAAAGTTISMYDTPGLINKSHISHALTSLELRALQPSKPMAPQHYILQPGQSLLLGGLGRLDYTSTLAPSPHYTSGQEPVFLTVFASHKLKVHVTKTANVERIHRTQVGTGFLQPPYEAADHIPPFGPGNTLAITGSGLKEGAADVVFPGVGWAMVSLAAVAEAQFTATMPEGMVPSRRQPLEPRAIKTRGQSRRGGGSQHYFQKKKKRKKVAA